jgi:ribosomal protein L37AE/L43A
MTERRSEVLGITYLTREVWSCEDCADEWELGKTPSDGYWPCCPTCRSRMIGPSPKQATQQ